MQLRLVLRVVLFGMLAYVCIPPALLVLYTLFLNICRPPPVLLPSFVPVSYLALRLILFLVVGVLAGRRVAVKRVANAALVGLLLAVGIGVLDTLTILILPKHHPPPGRLVHPPAGFFASAFFTYWRVLEIAAATVGGWMAGLRKTDRQAELPRT